MKVFIQQKLAFGKVRVIIITIPSPIVTAYPECGGIYQYLLHHQNGLLFWLKGI